MEPVRITDEEAQPNDVISMSGDRDGENRKDSAVGGGVSDARDYAIVARNLIRVLADGAAVESRHCRHIAETMLDMLEGRIPTYEMMDEEKLRRVARKLGLETEGMDGGELAKRVARVALQDLSGHAQQPLSFSLANLTMKRARLWQRIGVMPVTIEGTISDAVHRATMGSDTDPVPILFAGLRCAVADLCGEHISADLSDILFGTPRLVRTQAEMCRLNPNEVNIAVHGRNLALCDVVAKAAEEMQKEALEAGAKGINIVSIRDTGIETLMRNGISLASDRPSQALSLPACLLDLVVADHQCIMPSFAGTCPCGPAIVVTAIPDMGSPSEARIQPGGKESVQGARAIIELAIRGFVERARRGNRAPEVRTDVVAGFSLEQIEELCERINEDDPLSHLAGRIRDGTIRGVVLMCGYSNQSEQRDRDHIAIAEHLMANDVLIMATGCSAAALAAHGLMSPRAVEERAGEGLKRFIKELSGANGLELPPIWHMGSCLDNGRAANLATALAKRFGVDVHEIPYAASVPEASDERALTVGTWCVAMGMPTHLGSIGDEYNSSLVAEVLVNTARDVFGGYFIIEGDPVRAARKILNVLEHRRWALGIDHHHVGEAAQRISTGRLFEMAIEGAIIAAGYADQLLGVAIDRYGCDRAVEYPETGYELPSIFAWYGREVKTLGDLPGALGDARAKIHEEPNLENALIAGEVTMVSAEIVEALRYLEEEPPYAGTPYCGFVPDRVLREMGIAFVDDTIPGCAVLVGRAEDPKKLVRVVRDCQNKGMLVIAAFDVIKQLRDEGVQMGLEMMLYPVGTFTQAIHGLNFAIRAALSFGGIGRGERERLHTYLSKRPKVFVLQMGPVDHIKAAIEFAVMFNGSPTITDQEVEGIPERYVVQKDYDKMIQTAIEVRGIRVKLAPVDIPVAYGPAFEGETVRRPQTYVEAGGAAKTLAFELLRMRPEEWVEDGRITVIGKDVDEMAEGSSTPLAILVDVYGKRMQEDFETVLERRMHQFINFGEGCWHTGQRNILWIRLSKSSVAAGLKFKHLGDILVTKMKEEFGSIISRVEVTIITDEEELMKRLPEALEIYDTRDTRMKGLTDEAVDMFYSCTLCQSFAPDHVCVVTPERLGLCGAINWMDAKASKEISPTGPNQPIRKGECIDPKKGRWRGVNDAVFEYSHHKINGFNLYTMMEDPMTSCGCFECIVAMTADMQGVVVVNREFPGMTPLGMKFSTLAGSVGGGKVTPGFMGVGRKFLTSKKFIPFDGGFQRIAWMPKELKETLREALRRRAEELGVPDFVDKIADETITTDAGGLMEWMVKVDHPALKMPSLLS